MTIDGNFAETIRQVVDTMAQVKSDAAFLISPESRASVTFGQLQQHCILQSTMLRGAGLEKGDKVAFLMDNGLLTAQLFLSAMYGGFVAVPLNVRAGVMQLSYMLDHCDAAIVFVEDQYAALLEEALGSVRREMRVITAHPEGPVLDFAGAGDASELYSLAAEDDALLMYSSGSTGKPKGAVHTHRSILAHGRNSIEGHQLSSNDRSLLVLPLYHINAECVTLIPTLLSGGSVVVAPRFVVSRFWNWVDELHVTWSALVPTIIAELVSWEDPGTELRARAFPRIRFFRSSSAPLSPTLHVEFLDKFGLPLIQAMGSTEGGNVFSNPAPPGTNKIGSPGLPWGFETRIVDREGKDVPAGESGEVLLRSAALMKEYYKDPEGTAAVVDAQGWFHTGDLARQDEDGYFFVVGRSKELIIKGGVNIAPRQIDEVLEAHPAVLEAAAVGVPDRYFGEDAVAFVVLRSEAVADEKELLALCETRLGHFKTPSRIHFLRELPKGPSGKVQRLRLLDPTILAAVATNKRADAEIAPPTGEHTNPAHQVEAKQSIEQILLATWAEVLKLPHVDPDANFFALGGHSLLAIQCLSRLRNKLPLALTLSDFFEHSTVSEQAEVITKRLRGIGNNQQGDAAQWEQNLTQRYVPPSSGLLISEQDLSIPHPLSPAQQRLWFMQRLNPDVPVYNESEAVRLKGKLDVNVLGRAMNVVVDRHEVLRSTIRIIDELPCAVIHKSWPLRLKSIDLSSMPPPQREAEVARLLVDEVRIPYNLQAEPGIRVTVLRVDATDHVLILMMHHIVCDWGSEGIIWRELSAAYSSFLRGEEPGLPALLVSHAAYAAWQRQNLATAAFSDDLNYWEQSLQGAAPLLELPADRPRPAVMSYRGNRIRRNLDSQLSQALRRMSREEKTSLFTIFSASLNTLIYRYTQNQDILLGIPLADRDEPELQSIVGFLLHVHVLRTQLSGAMTFRELVSRVQKATLDLYSHRSAPFEQIVQRLHPERSLSYTPLFQIMFNWRERDQMLEFIGLEGLSVESLMASAGSSKFDLNLTATDIGEEISLEMEYNTDLFDEDRVAHMLVHFENLLGDVALDPGKKLSELSILTAQDQREQLLDWNNTRTDFPNQKPVHKLFEEQVARTPDAVALVFQGQELSYQQLDRQANQLAHHLRTLGVGPGVLAGLCVERSFDLVIGVFGILKAGGAYVPLDPSFPPARLRHMVENSRMRVLLTHGGLSNQLGLHGPKVVDLDSDSDRICESSALASGLPAVSGADSSYVLYTSGSTGSPKGVEIPHSALANFLLSMQREPGFGATDILLAVTTLSFDIAGLELYLPLITGGRVVLATRDDARDPMLLMRLMQDCGCTVMQATPATWRGLVVAGWSGAPRLKALCGGEALTVDLATELLPRCAELWNMYGPTETTVWSTIHRVTLVGPSVPVGRPIANTQIYILDEQLGLVPQGSVGELYIAGAGLARGYLHAEELTRQSFVPNLFSPGQRMYRSGDLARWLPDGTIECLGRKDNQVKLRGFRIELSEIEARLSEYSTVNEAAVVAREDGSGDKRLVAYYTLSTTIDVASRSGPEHLRAYLSEHLPEYMVPSAFICLEALPRTPNGKLDRQALTALDAAPSSSGEYESPQGDREAKLAGVWAEVLKLDRVGRHDNFFDLGGHSLMAVQLVLRLQKIIPGDILPLRAILEAPTVARLALWLGSRERNNSKILVKIRTGNPGQTPLFCIHGAGGNVLSMRPLAMALSPELPVYFLEAKGLDGSEPFHSVEETAQYYVDEIRTVQPHGPYQLAGGCYGGLVAYEMARMLEKLDQSVSGLFLIDTYNQGFGRFLSRRQRLSRNVRFYIHRTASHALTMLRLGPGAWPAFVRGRVKAARRHMAGSSVAPVEAESNPAVAVAHENADATTILTRVLGRVREASRRAAQAYVPKSYGGSAMILRARERRVTPYEDETLGWRPVVQGTLETFEVDATHITIMEEPAIHEVAAHIASRIQKSNKSLEDRSDVQAVSARCV